MEELLIGDRERKRYSRIPHEKNRDFFAAFSSLTDIWKVIYDFHSA
jgi:hypothetical protein